MNQIKTTQKNGIITTNFSEIKKEIEQKVEEYKGYVFCEDSVSVAKKEVASLRKLVKEINDAKISVKKDYLKHYNEWEKNVKELIEMINVPIESISDQLDEFESKRISAKQKIIKDFYNSLNSNVVAWLPFSEIYNVRWELVGEKMKSIEQDIISKVALVEKELQTIENSTSDGKKVAIEIYKKTFDLSKALSCITQYEQQKADILINQEKSKNVIEYAEKTVVSKNVDDSEKIPYNYIVQLSDKEKELFERFMLQNSIKFTLEF